MRERNEKICTLSLSFALLQNSLQNDPRKNQHIYANLFPSAKYDVFALPRHFRFAFNFLHFKMAIKGEANERKKKKRKGMHLRVINEKLQLYNYITLHKECNCIKTLHFISNMYINW
jgi:hypothetical protein